MLYIFFLFNRCDCVGILKERNVDVEHRFPEESSARSKKKSTRCRMVFRTTITHPNGSTETLQVTSQPIVCSEYLDLFVYYTHEIIMYKNKRYSTD